MVNQLMDAQATGKELLKVYNMMNIYADRCTRCQNNVRHSGILGVPKRYRNQDP
jgi:hypothetical protein